MPPRRYRDPEQLLIAREDFLARPIELVTEPDPSPSYFRSAVAASRPGHIVVGRSTVAVETRRRRST
jgi:hypothetical protein